MPDVNGDWQLLQRYVREQSQEAFGQLVARYSGLVFFAALRHTRHRQLSEDVTQAVFIFLARSAAGLRPAGSLKAWLHQTTLNAAANALRADRRRQRRERAVARDASALLPAPDETTAMTMVVEEELHRLSEADRLVLVLHYLEENTMAQTATILGVSLETARKRLARALERLRGRLARRGTAISGAAVAWAIGAIAGTPAQASSSHSMTVALAGGEGGRAFSLASELARAVKLLALKKAAATVAVVGLLGGAAGIAVVQLNRASAAPPVEAAAAQAGEPAWQDEPDAPAARAEIVAGIRANKAKLKQMAIFWTLTTDDRGFSSPDADYSTTGTYEQWLDGTRIATRYETERVHRGPGGANGREKWWIDTITGRSVSLDGKVVSTNSIRRIPKGQFAPDENWFDVLQWSDPALEMMTRDIPGATWSAQSARSPAGRQIRILAKSKEGSGSDERYGADKGFNLTSREWYNDEGKRYLRETRTLKEVADGVWMPVEIDIQSLAPATGEIRVRKHFVVNLAKSRFNDPTAIPANAFEQRPGGGGAAGAPGAQPEARRFAAPEAQAAVSFLDAVKAGDDDKAAGFCDPRSAVAGHGWIKDFRAIEAVAKLRVERVISDEQAALATTSGLAGNHDPEDALMITLRLRDGKWLIEDIDLESPQGQRDKEDRFRKQHPDAKPVEPLPESGEAAQ